MRALVYEGPHTMNMRDVPIPALTSDSVLVRVAYSGICGSELSGYEGKNALRKPPLIMGHEFSGEIEAIGEKAQADYPALQVGQRVTINPLLSCRKCVYCLSGRQQLCPERKLIGAHMPGSFTEVVLVRADAVYPIPDTRSIQTYALTEPAACAVHAVALARPQPNEIGLVIGAGPIGIFIIQALRDYGMKTIYCTDLNAQRLAMAEASGAIPLAQEDHFVNACDLVVDAVGLTATRQMALAATRNGGRVIWIGLHEATSALDINDAIRREITAYGTFAYTPLDFTYALDCLTTGRLWLEESWTRVDSLANGSACFEELLHGSPVAKIWLTL